MKNFFLFAGLTVLIFWYLSFSAGRLDRLHHRVETSWATLDSLLQRRAAIALEVATRKSSMEPSPPPFSLFVVQTALSPVAADDNDEPEVPAARHTKESALSVYRKKK